MPVLVVEVVVVVGGDFSGVILRFFYFQGKEIGEVSQGSPTNRPPRVWGVGPWRNHGLLADKNLWLGVSLAKNWDLFFVIILATTCPQVQTGLCFFNAVLAKGALL